MKRSISEVTPEPSEEEGKALEAPKEDAKEGADDEVPLFLQADALTQTGDDLDFLKSIIVESLDEIDEKMTAMRNIFMPAAGNERKGTTAAEVRSMAHAVKGVAACFAYYRMRDAAKELEAEARSYELEVLDNRPEKRGAFGSEGVASVLSEAQFGNLLTRYQRLDTLIGLTKEELATQGFNLTAEGTENDGSAQTPAAAASPPQAPAVPGSASTPGAAS